MVSTITSPDNLTQYRVNSRREIIRLLREIRDHNQFVSMRQEGSSTAVVTSILDVDEPGNQVIIDRAPQDNLNQRMIGSEMVTFETVLDNIRIVFFAENVQECLHHDGAPALCISIPENLIRLQRREHYRVPTPVVNPPRCSIRIPANEDTGASALTAMTIVKNISGGGIAIVDEKKILDNAIGSVYKDCKLDIPGGPPITVSLQIRNSLDLTLPGNKSARRLGCMFMNISPPNLTAVQRYIMKLERERNTKTMRAG